MKDQGAVPDGLSYSKAKHCCNAKAGLRKKLSKERATL